jgi:glycosyltransferase involved in cell wall biosynthesis
MKVSIIMATYNRAHFLPETLQSIINQTYADWECLIIDDGSTDNTTELLSNLVLEDHRFKYYKRNEKYTKGLPGCRNYGIDIAKGDYVIFFDDDDIVHPQNLEFCVNELEKNNVDFCRYLRSVFVGVFDYKFDMSKEYSTFFIDINDLEKMLKNILPFNSCSVLWKKECFLKDRFEESLMYAEEWELYSRILSNGLKGVSIEKYLFFGRKHLHSNTGEFYQNNSIRLKSYKEAIILIVNNLTQKTLLTQSLLEYFIGLVISLRDLNLLNELLIYNKIKNNNYKTIILIKYKLFPFWKLYKKTIKYLNHN